MPAQPLPSFEPIPVPPQPPASQGWGARISAMLQSAFIGFVNVAFPGFGTILSLSIKAFIEDFEHELIQTYDPYLAQLEALEALPLGIKDLIAGARKGEHPVLAVMIIGAVVGLFSGGIGQILQPLFEVPRQLTARKIRSTLLSPQVMIELERQTGRTLKEYKSAIELSGLPNQLIDDLYETARGDLPPQEIMRLWFRFPELFTRWGSKLKELGWYAEDLDDLAKATKIYPGIQDIIRAADRRVYDNDLADKFQYDADINPQAFAEADKLGFDQEFSKLLWRAHWEQPGVQQVFEMFHRLRPDVSQHPVTLDDIKDFLKVIPISSFWHDRIIDISYDIVTRVDARRLFDTKVWDRNRLKQAYLDLGYKEQDAEDLTKWSERDTQGTNKDLTRQAIETAYTDKIYDKAKATQALIDLGYDENEAGLYLNLIDFRVNQKRLNEDLARLEYLFVNNELDTTGVTTELGQYNLPAEQISELFATWDIRRKKNISLPTQGELEEYYLNHIITIDDYRNELKKKNYSDERLKWTLVRADQKLAASAKALQEKAQQEQTRLQQSTATTNYQLERQDLEIQQATLNLQIADIKVALHDISDPDQIDAAKVQILQLQDGIKSIDLQKAQLLGQFIQNKPK